MNDSLLFNNPNEFKSVVKYYKNLRHKLITALGEDRVQLLAFSGSEAISQLYKFKVVFASSDPNIDFAKILKKQATIELSAKDDTSKLYISGMVNSLRQGNTSLKDEIFTTLYELEIVPNLHVLTLNRKYTFYQNKTTVDIIKDILKRNGISNVKYDIVKSGDSKRESCIQYDESDYDFLQRIIAEEGIFFFFKFEKGKEILIFADDNRKFVKSNQKISVIINFEKNKKNKAHQLIDSFVFTESIVPGKYLTDDYDYNKPNSKLSNFAKATVNVTVGDYYDFDNNTLNNTQLKTIANIRAEGINHLFQFINMKSICWLNHGLTFELFSHQRQNFNEEYVVDSIDHEYIVSPQTSYKNVIKAFSCKNSKYRPSHIVPRKKVIGYLPAIVTGPSKQEVFRDALARVRIRFLWDSDGIKNKENSSGWVRVMQFSAGSNFGTVFVPRIGQEVIITFMGGNPDRPLIMGSVYNGQNKPPYKDPDISCIKTKSFEGTGFNEIKFIDKKKSEKLAIQAQKDFFMLIKENSDILLEKGDYTLTLKKGNVLVNVKGDVNVKSTGNIEFAADKNIQFSAKKDITLDSKGKISLKSLSDTVIDAKGDITVKALKNITLDTKMSVTIKSLMSMTLDAKMAFNIKSMMTVNIDAKMAMTLKANLAITIKSSIALNVDGTLLNAKGTALANLGAAIVRIG